MFIVYYLFPPTGMEVPWEQALLPTLFPDIFQVPSKYSIISRWMDEFICPSALLSSAEHSRSRTASFSQKAFKLVSCGCCNKLSQTWYFSHNSGGQKSEIKVLAEPYFLWKSSRGEVSFLLLASDSSLPFTGFLWLVVASLQFLPPSSHLLFLYSVSVFSSLKGPCRWI